MTTFLGNFSVSTEREFLWRGQEPLGGIMAVLLMIYLARGNRQSLCKSTNEIRWQGGRTAVGTDEYLREMISVDEGEIF